MTTYSTQNPLGSADPRDLYDNAENADRLINGAENSYPDRLGNARLSWAGIESRFADFLANSGYQFIGDYAAGIEITEYNQVIRDTVGEFWRVSGSTALPYTTTGAGLPEGGAFVTVGDAALRQELAAGVSTGQGGMLVSGAVIYVDTIADLQALDTSALVDGQQVDVAGTTFQYNSATADFTAVGYVSAFVYGGDMFGASDCSAAIQSALNNHQNVVIPQGAICRCDTMIEVSAGQSLYIQAGASLVRQAAHSISVDPVVWVKGSGAACFGDNRRTSILRSENRTPRGVLRLGHRDMTESHANVTYSQVYNISLIGAESYGHTDSREPDVCLYLPNPHLG